MLISFSLGGSNTGSAGGFSGGFSEASVVPGEAVIFAELTEGLASKEGVLLPATGSPGREAEEDSLVLGQA
ncbi:MAG TPA: hypothetical protein VN476_13460 [Pyrinomonadaceae bacterium]|nr:hypothetical protein [Pyrinomonadaceae bacterium]